VGVFEEAVHEDDEFAHDGGEGEFGGFVVGAEALIEGFEDGVVESGGEGGHIEDFSDSGSAAVDVALSAVLAAAAVERRHAGQGGGFGIA
jgi:hypothetical protein